MQTTNQVMMIRPTRFMSNPQTATSNTFQNAVDDEQLAQAKALLEFDSYVLALRRAGISVMVIDDQPLPHTPDSIFPNNWISCHADGRIFLYPMEAPNRRQEKREAILARLTKDFMVQDIINLGHLEAQACFLEGTGSMVFDHEQRLAYVCHSSRSHPAAMQEFVRHTGYRPVWFHACDRYGRAIYHTNVMMCVGKTLAIVCTEAIQDRQERTALCATLTASGKQLISISWQQMEAFAGNMLELKSVVGAPVFAMSRSAWAALTRFQQETIAAYAEVVLAPIENIEYSGGGSARCMLAEIFLPEKAARQRVQPT
ncbi:arginine deiminase-related protein [Undibacterium sp. TS12]|uniref:citrulline utilization hydrolase CtlX n=1 Tax=Undibacterium sp. TS12 TaxID=2908202 RepID=UPI001F4D024B|nr:arginine deiminase-related protein [Undibacterium sp. TS12]MCH8621198.1 arginine deiminase-related protein [Undibacterium sp. TS12]